MTPSTEPKRREDAKLLLGKARFVDDVQLHGMLHAVFLRSPLAHARIVSINTDPALRAGAAAVFTAADLPFNRKPWIVRYWHPGIRGGMPSFLADERVRHVGEPVAMLVAATRYAAEDLAALIEVEYDDLPALSTVDQAQAPGAVSLHDSWPGNLAAAFEHRRGDAAAALAACAHRVQRRFHSARQTPLALETRGVVADFDASREQLTVWSSTQAHYHVRQNIASALDWPEQRIRVIAEDVGGGFGAKSRAYPEEILVSHASRVLQAPVKWIEDRLENFQATTHSRGVDVDLELGCDAEGRIAALRATLTLDVGAYVHTSGIVTAEVASAHLVNAYRIEHLAIDVRCVGSNKTPAATYRGAGQPESAFPTECLMDVLAKQVGLSAAEIRQRNLVAPQHLPYATGTTMGGLPIVFESGDFPTLLERCVTESGYREEVEQGPGGQRSAWGLACGIEGTGFVNFESALVRVDAAGSVTVLSGMTTQGQGQITTLAQVCAEALGVDFEHVTVCLGDTALLAFGRGAFASRGAIFGGNAVLGAAQRVRAKALAAAARLLQCDAATLTIEHGIVRGEHGRRVSLGELARAVSPTGPLFDGEMALEAQYVYRAEQPLTYGLSAHAARVTLDTRTGFYRVTDYLVAHDAGRVLNQAIVDGQVVGGVVDGLGGAMFSEIVYDEGGQLITGSLADYAVALAPDVPRIRLLHMETRPGTNPLGVRGIGEGGIIPVAAAVANALARAIDPMRHGHEQPLLRLPLKPERVFEACRLARAAA